jgi:hypothetical protein
MEEFFTAVRRTWRNGFVDCGSSSGEIESIAQVLVCVMWWRSRIRAQFIGQWPELGENRGAVTALASLPARAEPRRWSGDRRLTGQCHHSILTPRRRWSLPWPQTHPQPQWRSYRWWDLFWSPRNSAPDLVKIRLTAQLWIKLSPNSSWHQDLLPVAKLFFYNVSTTLLHCPRVNSLNFSTYRAPKLALMNCFHT